MAIAHQPTHPASRRSGRQPTRRLACRMLSSLPARGRWSHTAGACLLILGVAVGVGGCAGTGPGAFVPEEAERVLHQGFSAVHEKYIREVPSQQMGQSVIGALTTMDHRLTSQEMPGQLVLGEGSRTATLAMPLDEDPGSWSRFSVAAIQSARTLSPVMAKADSETIYKAIFDRLLADLDPYSRYAGRVTARDYRALRHGYGGVGVRLRVADGKVEVIDVIRESPAEQAGIEAGDIILAIDTSPVEGLASHDVVSRLRGPIGSTARLTILRPLTSARKELDLRRTRITMPTVHLAREDGLAILTISGFNRSTGEDVRKALRSLRRQETGVDLPLHGLVIDLRGNPGGLLDQAIDVADAFLERGTIVTTRGRHPGSFQSYQANRPDLSQGLPLAVLVNGQSASAAEILAAALQDHGRAIVIGSNTFGKGLVQNISALPNDGELILTWSRFHAPSGYGIDQAGLQPHLCTSLPPAEGEQQGDRGVEKALMLDTLADSVLRLSAWKALASLQPDRLSEQRKSCPRQTEKPELDLQLARALFQDGGRFHRTLEAFLPPSAAVAPERGAGF